MTDTSSLLPHSNPLRDNWLNQIHHGDCLELLAQLPDESVDLVVTSPPYNLKNSTGNGSRAWPVYDGHADDMPHEEYVAWQRQCLSEMLRVVKSTGAIFYNHCWRVQDGLFQGRADILDGFPLRQVVIWHRSGSQNHNPGYFVPDYEVIYVIAKPEFRLVDDCDDGAVWKIPQHQGGTVPDLPVWPVELPRRAIAATDAKIVLDPFSGSGTTAVAALLEGRDYIGIEQSARYVAIARQRVAETTSGRDIPALPLTPSPADPPKPEQRRFRGSVQVVFDHVQSVLAANGWAPAVLHQANVASDLALSKITVVRAIQALKAAGPIVVHNHGRWSTYALGNGQPQPIVSSITADVTSPMSAHFEPTSSPENDVTSAKNDVTSAISAHFAATSSPENDVTSAKNDVTSAMSAHFAATSSPENDVTSAKNDVTSAMSAHFAAASNPENDVTSAKNDVTSVIRAQNDVTSVKNDATSTPGPGPGYFNNLEDKNINPGPGPGVQQPGKNDVTSLNPSDGKISASVAWVETAQVLRQQMPRAQFNEFLAPCAGHSWAGDTLTVAAASSFAVQWLELTLHQDMANDALCSVVGCQGSIAYANLPDVAASGTSTVDDQTPAMPTSSAEGAYCPMHEEPHLRRRTQYPSMLRHERKHGDEVFYCAGESGTCSWASSAQVGVFVPAGQLQREPSEVQAAYVLKRRGRGL